MQSWLFFASSLVILVGAGLFLGFYLKDGERSEVVSKSQNDLSRHTSSATSEEAGGSNDEQHSKLPDNIKVPHCIITESEGDEPKSTISGWPSSPEALEDKGEASPEVRKAYSKDIFKSLFLGLCYEHGLLNECNLKQANEYYQKAQVEYPKVDVPGVHVFENKFYSDYSLDSSLEGLPREFFEWLPKFNHESHSMIECSAIALLLYRHALLNRHSRGKAEEAIFLHERLLDNLDYIPFTYFEGEKLFWGQLGTSANFVEAIKQYEIAADQGFAPAQYRLANCYLRGTGLKHDIERAFHYFELASKSGHIGACFQLAELYKSGKGGAVEPDPKNAFHYYQVAAHCGHDEAEKRLAWCYERGFGVEKSRYRMWGK